MSFNGLAIETYHSSWGRLLDILLKQGRMLVHRPSVAQFLFFCFFWPIPCCRSLTCMLLDKRAPMWRLPSLQAHIITLTSQCQQHLLVRTDIHELEALGTA